MGSFLNPHFEAVILTTPFFEPRHPRGSYFSSVRVTLKTYGFLFFVRMGRGVKAYALPNVPAKGTNARHVFATVGGVRKGVFDTPLQPGTSMELQNAIPCPLYDVFDTPLP